MSIRLGVYPFDQLDHAFGGIQGVLEHDRLIDRILGKEQHVGCCKICSSEYPPRVRRDIIRTAFAIRQTCAEGFQRGLKLFQAVLGVGMILCRLGWLSLQTRNGGLRKVEQPARWDKESWMRSRYVQSTGAKVADLFALFTRLRDCKANTRTSGSALFDGPVDDDFGSAVSLLLLVSLYDQEIPAL
jgi:hypothetical protein